MRPITSEDINALRKPRVWDLGNRILYDMCRNYPGHSKDDEIVAKIWLIGRSYAASIERRRNAKLNQHQNKRLTGDNFYETVVAPTMRKKPIDLWLGSIQKAEQPGSARTVTIHKRLMDLFHSITDLEKRSLASKYLHFHKPDAFFIYDSRARKAITKVVPRLKEIPKLEVAEFDIEYLDFIRRCIWLRDNVQKTLDKALTPREIDNLLLMIADEVI